MRARVYIGRMSDDERFWVKRLQWRLRGAPLWPAFALFTVLDAVVLNRLPPASALRVDAVPALLVATFGNLFVIGVLAPFVAWRLHTRRRAALEAAGHAIPAAVEREVLSDRIGVALLVAGLAGCLVSGLANRPVIVSETEATEAVGRELRAYVDHSGSAELQRNLETANTVRLSEGYFRVCIARDDRRRFFCLFIDTDKEPTDVRRDPSAEPNTSFNR